MDCRWALVLAAGVGCGCLGCVHGLPVKSESAPSAGPVETVSVQPGEGNSKDGKPRTPKAVTCYNIGNLRESAAEEEGATPQYKEAMREEARRAYQKALETDPNYMPASVALARLYDKSNDHDRALATYQKILKKQPKDAAIYAELGMSHARQKEWDRSLENLRKACELDPENRQYIKSLGFCLARAGRPAESVACLRKVMSPADANCNVARMLHHLKQDETSKEYARAALANEPQHAGAIQLLDELEGRLPAPVPGPAADSVTAAQ